MKQILSRTHLLTDTILQAFDRKKLMHDYYLSPYTCKCYNALRFFDGVNFNFLTVNHQKHHPSKFCTIQYMCTSRFICLCMCMCMLCVCVMCVHVFVHLLMSFYCQLIIQSEKSKSQLLKACVLDLTGTDTDLLHKGTPGTGKKVCYASHDHIMYYMILWVMHHMISYIMHHMMLLLFSYTEGHWSTKHTKHL